MDLEQVTDYFGKLNPDAIQRNFDALEAAGIGFGGKTVEVRFGTGTWTWPGGSSTSNDVVINHGLGRVPAIVIAAGSTQHGLGEVNAANTFTYTATQFTARGVFVKGFAPGAGGTASFVWIAIG